MPTARFFSGPATGPVTEHSQTPLRRTRTSLIILAVILGIFVVIRTPVMWRQPGGTDEDYYAVPGLTVLESGIPRLPHVPQRDPQSGFYLADQALFAVPPLSFYWQAPFYWLLPDIYGAARLASAVAGIASIWLIYELGWTFYRREAAALWGAGLYSLARSFYFPAMTGRPDMLCSALGLGALLCVARWSTTRRSGLLIAAGVLLGLAGLTHPVALVPAAQAGVWVGIESRGVARVTRPALLAAVALMVFALWTPLILQYPEAFRGQFVNNILAPAGPGLISRLVFPWKVLNHHAGMMWEHLGAIQFTLLLAGAVLAAVVDWRSRARGPVTAAVLALSSLYLLSTFVGVHPTRSHWSYPTALLCVCVGRAVTLVSASLVRAGAKPNLVNWVGGALLATSMLPGAGVRAWWAYVRHWDDVEYNAPAFARRIMADLPADARYTVDRQFVLDFIVAGRRTLSAENHPFYFSAAAFPYDYLVVGRSGLDPETAKAMNGELIGTYGDREDIFACYAEIYRPKEPTGRDD